MLGVDQRESHKGSAVFRPGGQYWKIMKIRLGLKILDYRSAAPMAGPYLQQSPEYAPMSPELAGGGRHDGLGKVHGLANQLERTLAECHLGSPGAPEEIRDAPKTGPLHLVEEKSWTFGRNHSPVNFGDLEIGVDLGVDFHQLSVSTQGVEKASQILERVVAGQLLAPSFARLAARPRARSRAEYRVTLLDRLVNLSVKRKDLLASNL